MLKFSTDKFLKDVWQNHPAFLNAAIDVDDLSELISADELAGLAIDADIESRIVKKVGPSHWECANGPFNETIFSTLPETDWTLLVQDCDKWITTLDNIRNCFRFIPNWRFDDLMISYAVPGGSVGPHTDEYDVFLIQLSGTRRWQIARQFDPQLICNSELAVLDKFEHEEEYTAEPGDVLYLPPNVAHYGVATSECLTLSVGFRSPSPAEILSHTADDLCDNKSLQTKRITSANEPPKFDGEISSADMQGLKNAVIEQLEHNDVIIRSALKSMTETKAHFEFTPIDTTTLTDSTLLELANISRMAFHQTDSSLFIGICGDILKLNNSIDLNKLSSISNGNSIRYDELLMLFSSKEFVDHIVQQGYFYVA